MKKNKALTLSVIFTYIFLGLVVFFAILLPFLVTWYVETMGRSASLPTTIFVTCYPCAPFTVAILIYLRKLLKNAQNENLFCESSIRYLKNISLSCIVIAVITLISGRYYMPFYIVGATFAFLALLTFALKNIFRDN